ncbi:LysR substrate-binding domain-containing protein, partial [Streptomyces flaveolus]|uniref:LysR substrate-binding domain-containing protein n=1 Tax=Streptomyces flaveolus TaxID=67297 RepID=UPI003F575E35
ARAREAPGSAAWTRARSCAAVGPGLTLLPATTVAEHLRDGRLHRIALDGPPRADVPVRLARHRRRWAARAAREVARVLVRHLAPAEDGDGDGGHERPPSSRCDGPAGNCPAGTRGEAAHPRPPASHPIRPRPWTQRLAPSCSQ